ncbi:triose-phosphate isomerase [candidate division WWE3 bacterium]|nr:triose-phosphate isomerase [candidate division WWE3 bacterium]
MNKYWVVANWKLNNTYSTAEEWLRFFYDTYTPSDRISVGIAPSFTELGLVSHTVKRNADLPVQIMAQDVSRFNVGKYTGEVGAFQLLEHGVSHCIVGHSERRQYFNESNDVINEKIERLLNYDITPLIAVSEIEQVQSVCEKGFDLSRLTWAYEPISAIGTGNPADPHVVASFLKSMNHLVGEDAYILYGGSVTAETVKPYLAFEQVDGFLVGGASVKANEFIDLLHSIL